MFLYLFNWLFVLTFIYISLFNYLFIDSIIYIFIYFFIFFKTIEAKRNKWNNSFWLAISDYLSVLVRTFIKIEITAFYVKQVLHYIILYHTTNPTAFVMTIWVSSSYFHIRIGQNIKLVQKKDCFYIGLSLSLLTSMIWFQQTFIVFSLSLWLLWNIRKVTSVVYTILSGMSCLEISI